MIWLFIITLPFLTGLVFQYLLVQQYVKLEQIDIKLASEFNFNEPLHSAKELSRYFLGNKMSSIYLLVIIACVCFFISATFGQIVLILINTYWSVLGFGTYYRISIAKRNVRCIHPPIDQNYRPIVNMHRLSFLYHIVLFTIFNLFFDWQFLS